MPPPIHYEAARHQVHEHASTARTVRRKQLLLMLITRLSRHSDEAWTSEASPFAQCDTGRYVKMAWRKEYQQIL